VEGIYGGLTNKTAPPEKKNKRMGRFHHAEKQRTGRAEKVSAKTKQPQSDIVTSGSEEKKKAKVQDKRETTKQGRGGNGKTNFGEEKRIW